MNKFTHPLQDALDMGDNPLDFESDYAQVPAQHVTAQQPTEPPKDVKDEDDLLVEQRMDEIYDAAMQAYEAQTGYMEVIEPRYAARNAEVAANFLNLALQTTLGRAKVKNERKRANQAFVPFAQPGGRTTNNLIVANREDILKMIAIDGEHKEVK